MRTEETARKMVVGGVVAGLLVLSVWWGVPDGEPRTVWSEYLSDLCGVERSAQYGEFFFDDLFSNNPEMWSDAVSQCGECPGSPACLPLEEVVRWRASLESAVADSSKPKELGEKAPQGRALSSALD